MFLKSSTVRRCAFVVLTLLSVAFAHCLKRFSLSPIKDGLQQCGEGCDGRDAKVSRVTHTFQVVGGFFSCVFFVGGGGFLSRRLRDRRCTQKTDGPALVLRFLCAFAVQGGRRAFRHKVCFGTCPPPAPRDLGGWLSVCTLSVCAVIIPDFPHHLDTSLLQRCACKAAHPQANKAVPNRKSVQLQLVPQVHHKRHTDTIYESVLVKAQNASQESSDTIKRSRLKDYQKSHLHRVTDCLTKMNNRKSSLSQGLCSLRRAISKQR